MILQALCSYYERRMADPDPARRLPEFGFEDKEIPFILEINKDGTLVAVADTRVLDGKRKVGARYLVPRGEKKTSGIAANLLWDTAAYVLGIGDSGRVIAQAAAFRARVEALAQICHNDAGLAAVQKFICGDPPRAASADPLFSEIVGTNPVLSFRLVDDVELVCQRPIVAAAALRLFESEKDPNATTSACLVTGDSCVPQSLHTSIKGVWGTQSSGGNIVSFNLDSFRSFGKDQGANAPMSERVSFAYTTALNSLLTRGSRQRLQVGDASAVFWAQSPLDADLESLLPSVFAETDDPDARTDQIRALFESIKTGGFDGARSERAFYVLGLSPNAGRISIRFWESKPLNEIAHRIRQWFDDLSMVRGPSDPEYPSLFRLLTAVSTQGKADNIPPNLGGDIMRSILSGEPFPVTWLNAAIQRSRAEQQVTYLRAAAIKACLNRAQHRAASAPFQTSVANREVFTPMLDLKQTNTAYRLGRLFATLEKIQEEASPGLNATIRERYFGAASSTPVAVFSTLIRLKNHHLAKLDRFGRVTFFEKLIGEISSTVQEFPNHLSLPDQGRFALGYYHQRQSFFVKSEPDESDQEIER
jgi:CRISPR-associated protein Csd1